MTQKQSYRVDHIGKLASRRNYSKISGSLELPNLVEIQTNAFEWLLKEGLKEVFEEIYPIQNHQQTVKLEFVGYRFDEPKFSVAQCKYRESTYAAPLRAQLKLSITDKQSGEITEKVEEVFLGDFPLMSDSGTFVINGAERVIVSQIVRSPGAYFDINFDDRSGRESINAEFIPSRGTWLELMSDAKKTSLGRLINMKVDRKRAMYATVLFKALGLSMDDVTELSTAQQFNQFLQDLGYPLYEELADVEVTENERPHLGHYISLYTSIFGAYEELVNTLQADKVASTSEALRTFYDNQRSDEVTTIDGAISLMNAKFLDYRRYDLNKAGRFKVHKKLGVAARAYHQKVAQDILGGQGEVIIAKGTEIKRGERNAMISALKSGSHMNVYPLKHIFSHPDIVSVPLTWRTNLVGRVLAESVEVSGVIFEKGLVLTQPELDILALEHEFIAIYAGIMAKKVKLTPQNVKHTLLYGSQLFTIARLVDENQQDVLDANDELFVSRYYVDGDVENLTNKKIDAIASMLNQQSLEVYLLGCAVQEIAISALESDHVIKAMGPDPFIKKKTIVMSDIYAFFSYYLNLIDGIGHDDDIDMLGNRRIRTVGELIQNQFRIGLSRMERVVNDRMSISDTSSLTPKSLTNIRPLTAAIKEFFSSSQLSQFMDQINPLAELTNKRRISALGPGGLTRDRAGYEVRDVHNSHYGRICPIETPEGPNIGLISNLTSYGQINEYGFIQTPYRKVVDNQVTEDVVYLSADDEMDYVIAPANEVVDGKIVNQQVVARYMGDNILMPRELVELADVSPMQIVSVATACVPFLENDDASRALMGANMQRQSVPLIRPNSPYVGTGIEHRIARDSGTAVVASDAGEIVYVDSRRIDLKTEKDKVVSYHLDKFRRSNAGTCINQTAIVKEGDLIKPGDILADGPSMQNGELALGQNVVIAFMSWHGYNYEDAIIMSERLVMDDVYTSIHIEDYEIEVRETKLGPEEITRDIPNVSEASIRQLDADGIVVEGSEVKEGDILVGKVTPKGHTELPPEEKLLFAIFGEKTQEVRDNSLRVPHGGSGIVQSVRRFKRSEGYDLSPGVKEVVKVYIVQKRKISEGDKMAGRHGNKGVISKILPREDMPFLPDGTQVDIMLNPMGVPSRMNIGQVLEIHLGMAASKLGIKFATPVFDGIENDELAQIMAEANMSKDGKIVLHDGQTGDPFDERISVGVMYMIKLAHMVDDKLHARATGPYSMVTQQPLGGKAQNGGQRFGEMEVWALYAYGAAYTLQEIMTIKSDDINGRTKTYAAIQNGKDIPVPSIPESFRVLVHELQSLALDIKFMNDQGEEFDLKEFENIETSKEDPLGLGPIVPITRESLLDEDELLLEESYDDSDVEQAAFVGVDDYLE